eukprot:scaffold10478_cov38-Cyclotella_meneghiniana.AAC.4
MYDSNACWKRDSRVVSSELKKLTSNTAKYITIKENIHMRVKGMGWEQFKHMPGLKEEKILDVRIAKVLSKRMMDGP